MEDKPRFLVVSADVLPSVFLKVIEAKRLLSKAQAKNSSEACRMVGISRSAYYKYKDNVQVYAVVGRAWCVVACIAAAV